MTKEEQQQVHKMTTKANSANSSTADIHFSALCNAIEHEKLEKARAILETHPSLHLDLPNNDGFTPLDLAFMTGNQEMLKLLTNHKCEGIDLYLDTKKLWHMYVPVVQCTIKKLV